MLRLLLTALFVNCTRDLDPSADKTSRHHARRADLIDPHCIVPLDLWCCLPVSVSRNWFPGGSAPICGAPT